jgi:hypothetical protein
MTDVLMKIGMVIVLLTGLYAGGTMLIFPEAFELGRVLGGVIIGMIITTAGVFDWS